MATLSVVFLVVGSIVGLAWANSAVDGDVPAITVSPSTIVVAEFAAADLDLEPGAATLTLCGDYDACGSFTASDSVIVK